MQPENPPGEKKQEPSDAETGELKNISADNININVDSG